MNMNAAGSNLTYEEFWDIIWWNSCQLYPDNALCYYAYKDYIVPTWIHLLVCSVALALNSACVLGICTGCGKRNMRHHLVVSLCTSDIILVASEIFKQIFTQYSPLYDLKTYNCTYMVYESLDMLSHTSLVLNMAVMAIHHYIAVVKPLHYAEFISPRKSKIIVSAIWVISIIVGCSNFLQGLVLQTLEITEHYCIGTGSFDYAKMFRYYVHTMATSLCLMINVFCYVNILIVIRRIGHRFGSRAKLTSRHGKGIVTTMLFMLTFILLYLPFDVIDAVVGFTRYYYPSDYSNEKKYEQYFIRNVVHQNLKFYQRLNSIFDPLIYAFRQPDVLNGVKRCLCYCRKHPPRDVRCRSRPTAPETTIVRSHVTTEL